MTCHRQVQLRDYREEDGDEYEDDGETRRDPISFVKDTGSVWSAQQAANQLIPCAIKPISVKKPECSR